MKRIWMIGALAFLVVIPLSLWSASEGAEIYKSKCAACHGENGEGKPAAKLPAVKGTSKSVDQIVVYLTKGEAGKRYHSNPVSGLTEAQARAVAEYVKSLK